MPAAVQPIATVFSLGAVGEMLSGMIADLAANTAEVMLYQNQVEVDFNTQFRDLVEANFSGYARVAATVWSNLSIDSEYTTYFVGPICDFQCSGAGIQNSINGAALVTAVTPATVTFTLVGGEYTAPVVGAGGGPYLSPPVVTITGATGSGASAVAIIDSTGAVTSVVITSPGSGYTTATATIDGNPQLQATWPFQEVVNMALATDLLTFVPFLNMPASFPA